VRGQRWRVRGLRWRPAPAPGWRSRSAGERQARHGSRERDQDGSRGQSFGLSDLALADGQDCARDDDAGMQDEPGVRAMTAATRVMSRNQPRQPAPPRLFRVHLGFIVLLLPRASSVSSSSIPDDGFQRFGQPGIAGCRVRPD
jgi:hypothetical protein